MSALVDLKDRTPRPLKDVANVATRRYAVATAAWRTKPDFLVIGTKRGGTTSTFNYLIMHPGILGLFPQPRVRKSSDYFFKEKHRGEAWYRSHFHTRAYRARTARRLGYEPVSGEASPYYLWDPRIARAVHDFAPSIKAVALLRDPVERAWSHYKERCNNGVEPLGFLEALDAEDARLEGELERMAADPSYYSEAHDWYSYASRGVYLPQLQNWRSVFPEEQLLVLRSEDLYADVQATFEVICEFLGLPHYRLPTTKPFGAGRASSVPAEARERLEAFFAPHNRALEEYLGRSLGWPGSTSS